MHGHAARTNKLLVIPLPFALHKGKQDQLVGPAFCASHPLLCLLLCLLLGDRR